MVDLRFPFDDLRGKTAVVTGSARGIGLSTAHALADVGMTVLLVDRDEQELAQAVKGFPDQSRFAAVAADLASDAATPDLTEALRNLPPLAVWVNNAGRTSHQAAAEVDLSEFERVIRDNTTSALRCSQVAYRGFRTANAGGAIVNVCSLTTERVLPDRLSYATSKAALESITRYSASEWGVHGIRVNAVSPGYIETRQTQWAPDDPRALAKQRAIAELPLRRAGQPSDIARTVLYLASSLASYVTGQTIFVGGGWDLN